MKGCCCKFTDNSANKIIAVIIVILQIAAYIMMTRYLIANREHEFESRENSCYGPNCNIGHKDCMNLTTGGLMSVLLIVKLAIIQHYILQTTKYTQT